MKKLVFIFFILLPVLCFSQTTTAEWHRVGGAWDAGWSVYTPAGNDTIAVNGNTTVYTKYFRVSPYMTFNIIASGTTVDIDKVKFMQWDQNDSTKATYIFDLSWKSHSSSAGSAGITAAGNYSCCLNQVGTFNQNEFGWLVFEGGSSNSSDVKFFVRATGWNQK